MNLIQLIADLPIKVHQIKENIKITGLCSHSKSIAPGNLFIAKRGSVDDGALYIEEAIHSGANAILTDLFNPFLKDVTQLITENVSSVEAELASRFYQDPSNELFLVGITGTNGKTTTAYLIKHLLDHFQVSCGMIGTIEYVVGNHHFAAELTTPNVVINHKLLREMVSQRCKAAVMEVSSIGLEQKRVEKIAFDLAIFSNLSEEHLDYHTSMETYAQAKAKLFNDLNTDAYALFNIDSKWFKVMQKNCQATSITYGLSKEADIYAHQIVLESNRTQFCVTYRGKTLSFTSRLIGQFNIYNCLAAIGAALCKGMDFESLPRAIAHFSFVPGRLELVENLSGFNIYVDYAHTPDALDKALLSLRDIQKEGKIFTVFGCGGDRDRTKRPLMAKASEEYSDYVIVTSDNPRTEDPLSICQEVAEGFSKMQFCIEVDRKKAIERAIEMATPDDLILIAGKGHEQYQIFAHQTYPFDDRQIAQEAANKVNA